MIEWLLGTSLIIAIAIWGAIKTEQLLDEEEDE